MVLSKNTVKSSISDGVMEKKNNEMKKYTGAVWIFTLLLFILCTFMFIFTVMMHK